MTRHVLPVLAVAALGVLAVTGVMRAGAGTDVVPAADAASAPTAVSWSDATAPRTAEGTRQSTGTTAAPRNVVDGARLFVVYNCGDCHGAAGSGAMAPSLQDNRWRYGGGQGEIFRSIAEGRPAGMPAWGTILSGPEMIALTAYVLTLGEGKDLTTENFTGATVERSGR